MNTPTVNHSVPTIKEALGILLGFVENHADKGNDAALGMVKLANSALKAEASRPIPVVVIEVSGGVVNVVNATHAVNVYVLDEDTEGGDESEIAVIDGSEVYLSAYGVAPDEALEGDAKFASTLSQIDAHYNSVEAKLEWVYPDEDSDSTDVLVDIRTGVVTILDRSELAEDYDHASVRRRVVLEDMGSDVFEVRPVEGGGWRIAPSLLANFVAASSED